MDHSFWLKRWQNAETGFHRAEAHPMLKTHWSDLKLAKDSAVFVPLCGKSSDMIWLAEQGHQVIGAELSPIAIDSFFDGLNLAPNIQTDSGLIQKSAGPFTLWQGDILDLTLHQVGRLSAVYDRAALVALPPDLQLRYAHLLAALMPPGCQLFLVSLFYDPKEIDGPPFSISEDRVNQLFSEHFDITCGATKQDALEESQNLKQRGLTALTESLYILTRLTTPRHEHKA